MQGCQKVQYNQQVEGGTVPKGLLEGRLTRVFSFLREDVGSENKDTNALCSSYGLHHDGWIKEQM